MPNVVVKSVESFSSEDAKCPASNLLAKEVRKWKCREPGEKSAYVVLRLDQPVLINGIDIGNEHSAFVEVLVARSGPANPEFKEILLTSSFMTPIESRNSTSTNRVRCFIQSALVESTTKDKWDLVKIVCTQPFNSRVQYGIAFISLHSPSSSGAGAADRKEKPLVPEKFQKQIDEEVKKQEAPKVMKLGRFTIREESPDSDGGNTSATNLFARWKESRTGLGSTPKASSSSPTVSTAAAIREASKAKQPSPAVKKPITVKTKPRLFDDDDDEDAEVAKPIKRNRESLLYDKDDDKPNEKLEKKIAEDRARQQKEKDAKKEKEKRDRSLQEKKENLHDTSVSKFKDFLFDEPPSSKPSSPEKEPKESQKPSTPSTSHKEDRHKHDSSGTKNQEKKEHKKRPSSDSSSSKNHTPIRNGEESSASKKRKLLDADSDSDEERRKRSKPVTYKPFNKLLENVVLVISGIQNPERGNLRSQALAMGGKYKSDWDSSCTHLICAFKNTPKYNQVHGKGKIVKKEWIERCHALRKRLSWRKFALDSNDAEQTDSEGEIVDISRKPKPEEAATTASSSETSRSATEKKKNRESPPKETDEEALAHYDLDDVVLVEQEKPETVEVSGSDTEEEIERVRNNQKAKVEKDAAEIYDRSTEDEGLSKGEDQFAPLDFLKGKSFFIDADVGAVDVIKLERYVNLYKGTVSKTATQADYVVTRNQKPMPESFKGELIKPLWIYECHDMECLIPTQRYRP